jgi:hypothetical protein
MSGHMARQWVQHGAFVLCPLDEAPMDTLSSRTGRWGHLNKAMHEFHVVCLKAEHDELCECPPKGETNEQ